MWFNLVRERNNPCSGQIQVIVKIWNLSVWNGVPMTRGLTSNFAFFSQLIAWSPKNNARHPRQSQTVKRENVGGNITFGNIPMHIMFSEKHPIIHDDKSMIAWFNTGSFKNHSICRSTRECYGHFYVRSLFEIIIFRLTPPMTNRSQEKKRRANNDVRKTWELVMAPLNVAKHHCQDREKDNT